MSDGCRDQTPQIYPVATCLRQKQTFLCEQKAHYAEKHKYRKSLNCAIPGADFISGTTSLNLVQTKKNCDTGVYPKLGENHAFIHGCQLYFTVIQCHSALYNLISFKIIVK